MTVYTYFYEDHLFKINLQLNEIFISIIDQINKIKYNSTITKDVLAEDRITLIRFKEILASAIANKQGYELKIQKEINCECNILKIKIKSECEFLDFDKEFVLDRVVSKNTSSNNILSDNSDLENQQQELTHNVNTIDNQDDKFEELQNKIYQVSTIINQNIYDNIETEKNNDEKLDLINKLLIELKLDIKYLQKNVNALQDKYNDVEKNLIFKKITIGIYKIIIHDDNLLDPVLKDNNIFYEPIVAIVDTNKLILEDKVVKNDSHKIIKTSHIHNLQLSRLNFFEELEYLSIPSKYIMYTNMSLHLFLPKLRNLKVTDYNLKSLIESNNIYKLGHNNEFALVQYLTIEFSHNDYEVFEQITIESENIINNLYLEKYNIINKDYFSSLLSVEFILNLGNVKSEERLTKIYKGANIFSQYIKQYNIDNKFFF